jgi:hypothetical protein
MLREMSWIEFQEWMAFDLIHPIGDRRGDWQAAQVCASIWNSAFARAGSRKRLKPSDFLLEFTEVAKDDPTPTSDASTPATPWQHMKFIAQMQVALAKADELKKQKRDRRGRR